MPTKNDTQQPTKTVVDEVVIEKTIISLSRVILICKDVIQIMGTKIGDDISKLESVLCKQGIKYNYDTNSIYPSRLLVVDPNYVFMASEKSACFYLEVLCDDGYKISSFFFRSKNNSEFGAIVDAINDISTIFLASKYVKSKKKVMDQVLCVRQDLYTSKDVAKIERDNDYVSLEIMSKERFEEVVIKWYEKKKFKDNAFLLLYFILLLIYPVYDIINKINNGITISISDLLTDFVCSWFFITVIGVVTYGFYLYFFDKDRENGGCIVFYFLLVAIPMAFVFTTRSCQEKHNPYNSNEQINTLKNQEMHKKRILNIVYICTGPQSKRYHRTSYCRGLDSCSDDIEEIDVSEAKDRGRTPCGICY